MLFCKIQEKLFFFLHSCVFLLELCHESVFFSCFCVAASWTSNSAESSEACFIFFRLFCFFNDLLDESLLWSRSHFGLSLSHIKVFHSSKWCLFADNDSVCGSLEFRSYKKFEPFTNISVCLLSLFEYLKISAGHFSLF